MKNNFIIIVFSSVLLSCSGFRKASTSVFNDHTHSSKLYAVTNEKKDTLVANMLKPYGDSVRKAMNVVIGEVGVELQKKSVESSLGNFLVDVMLWKAKQISDEPVHAAIFNQGGIRSRQWMKGPLTVGAVYELMPFDNFLVVQKIKGNVLRQLLNHAASQGGWPLAGITMQIKNKQAINIKVGDKPLDDDAIYAIVQSNYVAEGGDDAEMLRGIPFLNKGVLLRNAIFDFIEEQTKQGKPITSKVENRVINVD